MNDTVVIPERIRLMRLQAKTACARYNETGSRPDAVRRPASMQRVVVAREHVGSLADFLPNGAVRERFRYFFQLQCNCFPRPALTAEINFEVRK
jgi:hypothetical protein